MTEALRRTERDDVEHGFSVCRDAPDVLTVSKFDNQPDDICSGDDCSVQLPRCRTDKDYALEFHTHPKSSLLIFSGTDIYWALRYKPDNVCLGIDLYDKYIGEKFPHDMRNFANKGKGRVMCWRLKKDENGIITDTKSLEGWDEHYFGSKESFNQWFEKLHRDVRNGESELFEQTTFELQW